MAKSKKRSDVLMNATAAARLLTTLTGVGWSKQRFLYQVKRGRIAPIPTGWGGRPLYAESDIERLAENPTEARHVWNPTAKGRAKR